MSIGINFFLIVGPSGKGSFGKDGSFQQCPVSRDSREYIESLESPHSVENKGESDHFLVILKKL